MICQCLHAQERGYDLCQCLIEGSEHAQGCVLVSTCTGVCASVYMHRGVCGTSCLSH